MKTSFSKAFKNLFKEPQTIDYPATPIEKDKNYRGLIEYGEEECIYCTECVRACPKPDEALWQSNKKPPIGVKEDRVNEKWFELEKLKK